MSGDDDNQDHVVIEISRGETDVLRITRRIYEGRPFTDLRVFFRGDDGKYYPTKKGTSVRDSELTQVLDALGKIARKVEGQRPPRALPPGPAPTAQTAPPTVTRTSHRQAQLPGTQAPQPSRSTQADYDLEPDPKGLF